MAHDFTTFRIPRGGFTGKSEMTSLDIIRFLGFGGKKYVGIRGLRSDKPESSGPGFQP